jgi:hypothetical protein
MLKYPMIGEPILLPYKEHVWFRFRGLGFRVRTILVTKKLGA